VVPRGAGHFRAMDKTLFSFGHGFSARALAARLVPQGWRIIGTTRSADKMAEIATTGVEPVVWPEGDVTGLLSEARYLLVSAGPDANGDPVLNALKDEITAIAPNLRWAGYLSTTGVYGDHQGAWVDEDTPLSPATKRGQLRVEAEAAWQSIPDLPLHIFRLAGIYGPGRGPFAKLRKGTARRIIKDGQVFSRIHVDDIAQALELSMARPDAGAIYNLCDDDPAPPQDVIGHAAELLGLPLPDAVAFEAADMTPMARSFYAESKKVRNDRIKDALGWRPKYPDYRSGLAAMLRDDL
jgi:nucleoside-diphosphate-sugar epimerase